MWLTKGMIVMAAALAAAAGAAYRPVVLMHGLTATAEAMSHAQQWIEADFPGIYGQYEHNERDEVKKAYLQCLELCIFTIFRFFLLLLLLLLLSSSFIFFHLLSHLLLLLLLLLLFFLLLSFSRSRSVRNVEIGNGIFCIYRDNGAPLTRFWCCACSASLL